MTSHIHSHTLPCSSVLLRSRHPFSAGGPTRPRKVSRKLGWFPLCCCLSSPITAVSSQGPQACLFFGLLTAPWSPGSSLTSRISPPARSSLFQDHLLSKTSFYRNSFQCKSFPNPQFSCFPHFKSLYAETQHMISLLVSGFILFFLLTWGFGAGHFRLVQMLTKFSKTPYLLLPAGSGLVLENSRIQFGIFTHTHTETHKDTHTHI